MKIIVLAIITAIAAFMGWVAMKSDCSGGLVMADEAACRASGRSGAECADIFRRGLEIARRSGPTFNDRFACNDRFPNCIERSDITGWTARPVSYCVKPGGAGLDITPIYSTRP